METPDPDVVRDVVDFLCAHPPFDALDPAEVEPTAAATEIEFHAAGATILSQGAEPVEHLWVIRAGTVAVVHDGRLLDLLGPGELFGHASMLSGLPTGFEARASEDVLCYRIPADVVRPLLGRPAALRFVARSIFEERANARGEPLASDPAQRRVGALLRDAPLLCAPGDEIGEVARRMTAAGVSAAVVRDGTTLGIVTDRDLRSRVVAAGVAYDAPVSAVMSAPAYTVSADRAGSDVLLDMLDRGIRHFPVLSATGEVLGVVDDADLVAIEARTPFLMRRAITRATSVAEVALAAGELQSTIIALHEAGIAAPRVAAVWSVVVDALTRQLVELAVAANGPQPCDFAWLALGSLARREAVPGSDVDSAIVFHGDDAKPGVREYMTRIGREVADGHAACGLRTDAHGATAADALFVRSLDSWLSAARSLIGDPMQEQALILVSVIVDSRPVYGLHAGAPLADAFREARRQPQLLRLLARFALRYRPPTGFLRDFVVEHSGEHRGRLDLKHGGLLPIVDLARFAGMAAGVTSASTRERLRAADAAGAIPAADAATLGEAFELVLALRLDHQIAQLRSGAEPDDFLDPRTLSPLARGHLREAFRAVAAVQKRLSSELDLGVW